MWDDIPPAMARIITALEHCLAIMEEAAFPSRELEFLQTFLTNAKDYLSKDVAPDTEAMENWDTPENQAMLPRFIAHITHTIRMLVDDWEQSHNTAAADRRLAARLEDVVAEIEAAQQEVTAANGASSHQRDGRI